MKNSDEIPKFVADTHAVVWHMIDGTSLSREAHRIFQEADSGNAVIYISAITPIEMTYLVERKKIPNIIPHFYQIIENTQKDSYQIFDVSHELTKSFQKVPASLIPELPDRVIAATAYHLDLPLITKDRRIHGWKEIEVIW